MRILLTLLAAAAAFGQGITVRHTDGTSRSYAYAQLQSAIDNSLCGDVIELDPGAGRQGTAPYVLRNKGCTQYTTIRSSKTYQLMPGQRVSGQDQPNLAFLGLNSGCTVVKIDPGAGYWRLQGLEISAAPTNCDFGGNALVYFSYALGGGGALARQDLFPHHIVVDQCWIHGIDSYDIRDGVQLDGISMRIQNSTIERIRTASISGAESHGIVSYSGLGPNWVVNNTISAGMIQTLWGGADPTMQGVRTEGLTYIGNWLYRPFKWMDWSGTTDPSPLSPCPVDTDGHGATYRNTSLGTYWECQGAAPGTWMPIGASTYTSLTSARIPTPDKNVFELKDASRVYVEGNLFDQAYSWNFQSQHGACVLLNLTGKPPDRISHVVMQNNVCQHMPWGISQGQVQGTVNWDNGGVAMHNIVFRNNVFQYLGETQYTNPGFGNVSLWGQDTVYHQMGAWYAGALTDDHNTVIGVNSTITNPQNNAAVRLDGLATSGPVFTSGQRVTNGIITAGRAPVMSTVGGGNLWGAVITGWGPYAELSNNVFLDNLGIGTGNMLASTQHCDPGVPNCPYKTPHNTYPPSCLGCQYPSPAAVNFTNYPATLSLQAGSPLKGAGLDGKDLGADLNTAAWATVGAPYGALSPYLSMKIRAVMPGSGSVQVRFTPYDTSSCTVEARIYGMPSSAPVASAVENSGTLDRLVNLTGLARSTQYALKVTCAGAYYRETDFRTP
jgi:hypothetical protein